MKGLVGVGVCRLSIILFGENMNFINYLANYPRGCWVWVLSSSIIYLGELMIFYLSEGSNEGCNIYKG